MAKEKKDAVNMQQVNDAVKRIEELREARVAYETKLREFESRKSALDEIKTIKGVDSDEYKFNESLVKNAETAVEDAKTKVDILSYKQSELKPILDFATEEFQTELRKEQETEYSIEIGQKIEGDGKNTKTINTGVKAYNQLLDFLYHAVDWDAKTAVGLMVLVRNMEENKLWVRSAQFDNVIKLRSANVMVLYKSILDGLKGRGYETAKIFLECWTNCGVGISNAVKEINKRHENTRILGSKLNTLDEEFSLAENDLPQESSKSTKDEVAPDVQ